ncbi:MAG: glycosyl hydrolase family 28-related protein [Verrucomicrobiota bacterium]
MPLRPLTLLALAIAPICIHASDTSAWRSELFPEEWRPENVETDGRFLHDFSYAGYRRGEAEPPRVDGPVHDAVRDCGADNTGKTDATGAIQAAIDAAQSAGGGVVFIPEGDYLCLGGIRIVQKGVVLRGAGPGKTRLFFHDESSPKGINILINGESSSDLGTMLVRDVDRFSRDLFVKDAGGWSVGDDIDVGWVISDAFIEEHGMTGVWKPHNGKWLSFFRVNIVAIDTGVTPNRITVDVPLRYPAKLRDAASIKRRTRYLEECGVEDLSIANALPDALVNQKPQSVRREAIRLNYAKNCWIRNVTTFAPSNDRVTSTHHLYDRGMVIQNSKRITVTDCVLQNAQRRDGGGHGYLYEILGCNDVLFRDCAGIGGRHNFTVGWLFGSVGNVFLRCHSANGSLSDWKNALGPSDFHHSLAIAALIDSCVIDDGWEAMNRGSMSGGAGHTATESVFWNCRGNGVIRSAQYGWGYLIGNAASLRIMAEVDLAKPDLNWLETQFKGTLPIDFVEGTGRGDTLVPQSLYEEQRRLRLRAR